LKLKFFIKYKVQRLESTAPIRIELHSVQQTIQLTNFSKLRNTNPERAPVDLKTIQPLPSIRLYFLVLSLLYR